ncbi:MAG TPA: GTPase Era [Thermoanaerobaculia bacterium]|nr:GTPase Era [Thermoanaerobaculia bacterium]
MAKSGSVALIGRPNAGKSTLMNRWLGEKLSIVSDKPQTTRRRIVGILSEPRGQLVFYDTPGIHRPIHRMNQQMMRFTVEALDDADVVALLVDVSEAPGKGDAFTLDLVRRSKSPKVLLLNKIDLVKKEKLLPRIAAYAAEAMFTEIVPISARDGDGAERALGVLWGLLPEGEPAFDRELLTVQTERFLVAERIREKVLERTRDELPFATAVLIERWEEVPEKDLVRIAAVLLVERSSQKPILVGKGGERIRDIGTAARLDLEGYLGKRVYLELFVKVEPGWREKQEVLAEIDRNAEAVDLDPA